jgi:predicted acetyltransferase
MKKLERIKRQEEMLSLIEQWQESGQPQQTFCKERNLSYKTFYYWLRSYRRRVNESNFLPVEVSSGSHIEIRYPGGVVLQLPAETRLSTLKQLLSL